MTSLRQRMVEDIQIRNLAVGTQQVYVRQVSLFARHFHKSPELLGPEQIRSYQIHLTNEKKLDTNSIIVAMSALRFLYKITLKRNWSLDEAIPTPKKPRKLPVILSPEEVLHFLNCVASRKHRAILTTCYAAGLRIAEAIALNPPAIDSQRMVIRVEQGKGTNDRYVMLSPKLLEILRAWWRAEKPKDWLFPGDLPGGHTTPDAARVERPKQEVADIFCRYGEAYRQQHEGSLSTAQRRVMTAIEVCRTAALGGHLERCDGCNYERPCYDSCADRHCPKCQSLARAQWVEKRTAEVLPTHYFHVVFSVPEQIASIAYQNKKVVYDILFRAVAETLSTIAGDPKHLGAEIGFFAVLHSW